MKINLTDKVKGFNGKPFRLNKEEKTHQDIILVSLQTPMQDEKAEVTMKRFKLGLKCVADEPDLSLDERKLIKDSVAKMNFGPLIFGRITQLMEGEEEENLKQEHKAKKK